MRRRLYTLLSSFLLIALFNNVYAYDGQSDIFFNTDASNHDIYFVGFSVDFAAPQSLPPNISPGEFSVFLWPGLQPGGSNCFYPINNGVLQPVLSYGTSCAPDRPQNTEQWWISGQYVNRPLFVDKCASIPDGFVSACENYSHCHGGEFLTINPGQQITTSMVYDNTDNSWLQTIEAGGQTRTYSIALDYCSKTSEPTASVTREPQSQTLAILSIETHGYNTPLEQTYENILLKIQVGDDPMATCDNTVSMSTADPSSFCSSINMISNADGILTCQVDSCTVHKPTDKPMDTDNDSVFNGLDSDSENDGITNQDEDSAGSVTQASSFALRNEDSNDPDGDGIANSLDLDSDGDCIPDHFEAGGSNDRDRDGISDDFVDVDMDGLHDEHDPDQGGMKLPLPDTDNDGTPDFLDTDSDDDGVTDTNETIGGRDVDGDGIYDDSEDLNGDGLADDCHPATGNPLEFLDTDGDGIFDHLDSNNTTSQGGGCSVAPVGNPVSTLVYAMIPFFILIRRLWRRIR